RSGTRPRPPCPRPPPSTATVDAAPSAGSSASSALLAVVAARARRVTAHAPVAGSRLLTAFQAASAVAGKVPPPALGPLARLGGAGASLPDPTRRMLVARHLRRADPSLSGLALRRAVQRTFESYAAYWLEAF